MTWVSSVLSSLHADTSDLLSLSARAIRKCKIPHSWKEVQNMDTDTILSVAPVVTALMTVVALVVPHQKSRKKASYHLTRVVIVRSMALCYLAAFLTEALQYRALYSSIGVMPSKTSARPVPALDFLNYIGIPTGDWSMEIVCYVGVALAVHMLTADFCTFLTPLSLWLMHITIVNSGANVMNYGWEWLTAEVGFLVIFLHPVASRNLYPRWTPPSELIIFLFRWCAFRLMIGAGMSKMGNSSSPCWKQLTCTATHYFTQPLPSPLAWYAHHAPEIIHKFEVSIVFVEQLVLPFLLLFPSRMVRISAGVLEVALQLLIISTGNYAWINFIGIVPVLAVFDDMFWWKFFPSGSREEVKAVCLRRKNLKSILVVDNSSFIYNKIGSFYQVFRNCLHILVVVFCISKSGAPLKELFGSRPWLHFYDDYFFVNAHGVFGFINQERVNIEIKYSHDEKNFSTLDFYSIPGRLNKRPPMHTPYHYRLDWETWIYTTASLEGRVPTGVPAFLENAIQKLMQCDTDTVSLFDVPYDKICPDGGKPVLFKAQYYKYNFSDKENAFTVGSDWWRRKKLGKNFMYSRSSVRELPESRIRKSPDHDTRWIVLLMCVALVTVGFQSANITALCLAISFFPYVLYFREYRDISLEQIIPAIPPSSLRHMLATFVTLLLVLSDKAHSLHSVTGCISMIAMSVFIIIMSG